MERRFVLFLVLSFGILLGYSWLMPAAAAAPKPAQKQVARQGGRKGRRQGGREGKAASRKTRRQSNPQKPSREKPEKPAPVDQGRSRSRKCPSNGSRSARPIPTTPYRMLVTLDQQGRGRGADRAEQSALLRHRRSQRLPGPSGRWIRTPGQRAAGCRSSARARPPPRPA